MCVRHFYHQSPQHFISLFSVKVYFHQVLAVVFPKGGHSVGARFPQQTETETAVDMHPDLLLW